MVNEIIPIREIDDAAVELVERLLFETRYASLGVLEPESGIPLVSRVAAMWHEDTGFFFSASDLSEHSKCLSANANCSLLIGEPGKGDGLAYPRMTVIGAAERMANTASTRNHFRSRFLECHPKAELYIDFSDFGFYPLQLTRIMLNGGFGKAYHFDQGDLDFLKE